MGMILAILNANYLSHPPIEAVFTMDEETTMEGVMGFNTSLLAGKRLINLDAEVEAVFWVSSAAGADVDLTIPIETTTLQSGLVTYNLEVDGLTGGHSGLDIHKGLANANILMARLLIALESVEFYVSSIDGGSARNAISRECVAVISFAENNLNAIQSIITQTQATFKSEYASDNNLKISLEKTGTANTIIQKSSLQKVLSAITQLPNGVLSWSPTISGLVQTSSNLGIVITEQNKISLLCFPRSSSNSEQLQTFNKFYEIGSSLGIDVKVANEFPG
jgi:dipeptidase D